MTPWPDGTLLVIGHPANGRTACMIKGVWTETSTGEPTPPDDLVVAVAYQPLVRTVVEKARAVCNEELGMIDELPEWHEELAQACEALPDVEPFARSYAEINE